MKKIIIGFISLVLAVSFPLIALAEWVDADGTGQGGVQVYDSGLDDSSSQLALDSQGRPHIAYIEFDGIETYNLCYLYWNGSAWVDADGTGQESRQIFTGAIRFSFALDNEDRPGVSFFYFGINYLYWNGSAWVDADGTGQESMGVYGSGRQGASLRYNNDNQPSISFCRQSGFDFYVSYLSWNGSAWVDADGSGQESVDIYSNGRSTTSLQINSANQPGVSFGEQTSGDIYYLFWNGSAWVDADGAGQGDIDIYASVGVSDSPSLALINDSNPAIAWQDDTSGNYDIFYLYWNGSAWVDTDGTGQNNVDIYPDDGISITPNLAMNSQNDYPCVVWYDDTSGTSQIYYLNWNGLAWVDADGTGQTNVAIYSDAGTQNSTSCALALDLTNNFPHITWYDDSAGDNDIYYLEWYEESPTPGPSPSPDISILPEAGRNLVGYINRTFGIF